MAQLLRDWQQAAAAGRSSGVTTPWHVCIDLETLALTSNAVIAAAGWVSWQEGDPVGSFRERGEALIELAQPGRHICPETVMWWLRQEDAARNRLLGIDQNGESEDREALGAVLARLRTLTLGAAGVWTHDPSFDAAILKSANGGEVLWDYKATRCARTAALLVSEEEYQQLRARLGGTKHAPADDAALSGAVVQLFLQKTAELRVGASG